MKFRLLFFIGLFLSTLSSLGQQYSFINYNVEQGLAQSQVQSMCQDKDGFIWVATLGGISRFDGIDFVNFTKAEGLPSNIIRTLYHGEKSGVWFGTTGAFGHIEGKKITTHFLEKKFSKERIKDFVEDEKGNLWIAAEDAGLIYFDVSKRIQIPFSLEAEIKSVELDEKGALWIGTSHGIYKKQGKQAIYVGNPELKKLFVNDIFLASSGDLWFCTNHGGVFRKSNDSIVQYLESQVLPLDVVRGGMQDSKNRYWFATRFGLTKIEDGNFVDYHTANGLTNSSIECVMEDSEHNIWFGTDGGGFFRIANENFKHYSKGKSLNTDLVMAITQDLEGNHWLGSYDEGCFKFSKNKIESFKSKPYGPLNNATVWSTVADNLANVWFGTSNGLTHYNNGIFTNYNKEDGLNSSRIRALYIDDKQKLWVGTTKGVSVYDGDRFSPIIPSKINGYVRSIVQDKTGGFWFGSSTGLYRYNNDKAFLLDDPKNNYNINTMTLDAEEKLWIGTEDGLFLLKDNKFSEIQLPSPIGMGKKVNFLCRDKFDNIWVGTDKGIVKIDFEKHQENQKYFAKYYGKNEGLKSLETNLNASFSDKNGDLWFGTNKSLLKVTPQKEDELNEYRPKVYIRNIQLFFKDIEEKSQTSDRFGLPQKLVLTYKQNYLTFFFSGLQFSNPNMLKYSFKLDGVDDDWLPATKARFATYSSLPHGNYIFRVKAIGGNGIESEEEAVFTFQISPPFWLTTWFVSLMFLLTLLIIYLIFRSRVRAVRTKERTQQLIYTSKMQTLEQQTLNAHMNRHFIFNALNSIQYYINRQDRLAANKYLTSFAKLIRKNLDSTQQNLVSLNDEIERLELYLGLEHMRFRDKFSYHIDINNEVDVDAIMIPSMLLQPFVENSIWHGILAKEVPGKIEIKISMLKEQLRIVIEDDGIGINESIKRKQGGVDSHVSKGMQITTGRIKLFKKITNGKSFIKGPEEILSELGKPIGTRVEVVLDQQKAEQ